ncbi:MAG: HEAT repeat domain-containing protein [Planctomycetota bacterium]
MLPNPALKSTYDKIIWVYVYRDFSQSEPDRRAERIELRFGVTSWPQIFLADPATMRILTHTGRTVDSFLEAVQRTRVRKTRSLAAHERLAGAEARLDELERRPSVKLARRYLDDEDIVVRFRALTVVAGKEPETIVRRAQELLAVPHDPFRYEVCRVLAEAADVKAARALEALVADPQESLNPNVLRIRAVQALAACGDAASAEVVAPFARSGAYFNGLTGISVDALAAIAKRHRKARSKIRRLLAGAYPEPPDPSDARALRACVALAKRVHKARQDPRPFPKVYDEKARARLMR